MNQERMRTAQALLGVTLPKLEPTGAVETLKSWQEGELRTAWKKAAKEHHPDRHQDGDKAKAEETFKALKDAYEYLRTLKVVPKKREPPPEPTVPDPPLGVRLPRILRAPPPLPRMPPPRLPRHLEEALRFWAAQRLNGMPPGFLKGIPGLPPAPPMRGLPKPQRPPKLPPPPTPALPVLAVPKPPQDSVKQRDIFIREEGGKQFVVIGRRKVRA